MSMWGGRFTEASPEQFKAFNDSLRFDYVLAPVDLQASKVWAEAIKQQGILNDQEFSEIIAGIDELLAKLADNPELPLQSKEEDIHSWTEKALTETVGTAARKLHTGRSRNDLVATDLRLWASSEAKHCAEGLLQVINALLEFAQTHDAVVIPGYTHLQRAQPVLLAHWALAYVEMLERDFERLDQARIRMSQSPLGCGALAGSGIAVNRDYIAEQLGFEGAMRNSLDAVSDRDFVADFLYAASLSMVHLSRLCEDLVFYCSGEAGYFKPGDAISSGSSLMPQKKNPDVFELVRGKTGRVNGHLNALLMTLKGLPLAYNKDMQEDKEGFFDAVTQWQQCLAIMAFAIPHIEVNEAQARQAAQLGYSNATDLADYLVAKGIPFRDAHDLSGQLVLKAAASGCPLEELDLSVLRSVSPSIDQDVYAALELSTIMQNRNVYGGTAPARVEEALQRAWQRLQAEEASLQHVRQAKLTDVKAIAQLIRYWADQGEHLPRAEADIMQAVHQFAVAEIDGEIVGCGALYVYGSGLAEVRSLGLKPGTEGKGLGAELVNFLLEQARHLGIKRVIVLTRVPAFFAKLGFEITDKSNWPEKVMKDCEFCPRKHACDETGLEIEV